VKGPVPVIAMVRVPVPFASQPLPKFTTLPEATMDWPEL
jgi:hypothetical protein